MGAPLSSPTPRSPTSPHRYRRLHAIEAAPESASQQPHEVPDPPPIPRLSAQTIGAVAVFAFEAVEGTRQVGQLGKWITAGVAETLGELRALNVERRSLYRDHRRIVPSVRRVRATHPVTGVIEASVVLTTPARARAVALRFEIIRERWQATSITVL